MPIQVTNLTREQVLADNALLASTYWQRLFGLMGRKTLAPGEGLVIDPCSSVHTHWMRFAIDVIYVNKEHVVVGIDHNLRPWRLGRLYKRVQYVVELPAGRAHETDTQVGDQLILDILD
ncbi:MAG: DUF192 domain-containing protein [Anaerolineae bacterium]